MNLIVQKEKVKGEGHVINRIIKMPQSFWTRKYLLVVVVFLFYYDSFGSVHGLAVSVAIILQYQWKAYNLRNLETIISDFVDT